MLLFMGWFSLIVSLMGFGINISRIGILKPRGVYGASEAIITLIIIVLWASALLLHYY